MGQSLLVTYLQLPDTGDPDYAELPDCPAVLHVMGCDLDLGAYGDGGPVGGGGVAGG